jgi:hypothetical protein
VRRLALVLATLVVAAAASGESVRTLEHNQPAGELTGVIVTAGVGDVEIVGDASTEIRARVEITRKHMGWFGSGRSDAEIQSLEIEPSVSGGKLTLRVKPDNHEEHNFAEHWTVYVPAGLAVQIKLGVGDATVFDVAGDVTAELGVGDVKVEGLHASFGKVRATCGVGDATLRTPAGRQEGEGFVAHNLSATGPGKSEIRAEVGVGDVTVRLR